MAEDNSKNADFIGRVVGDAANPPDTRMLTGWLGDSGEPDSRRLYTDAELSSYVDIPNDAILYTESIRDAQPEGAVFVWIKRDAAVKQGGSAYSRAARFLQGQVQQDFAGGGGAAPAAGGDAAAAAGSLEKAGLRCATQAPCGEVTGFTGQCTNEPQVGGAWPCITARPHCAEPTGFTGQCTHQPWPNPTRYIGCTIYHCPTHDLTHIPHICNIVATGLPGCGGINPPDKGGDPAARVGANADDAGNQNAAAPATSLPGCGYTQTWGLCETHLLGCGETKDCPTSLPGCGQTNDCPTTMPGCGWSKNPICTDLPGCGFTKHWGACQPTLPPKCQPSIDNPCIPQTETGPQCGPGGVDVLGLQQGLATRFWPCQTALGCTVAGEPCRTIDACGHTHVGARCHTLPNGDCTFFGNCGVHGGAQLLAAGNQTAATVCTQIGCGAPQQVGAPPSLICATNVACNYTSLFCHTRIWQQCHPTILCPVTSFCPTRFQPQCFPIPSPFCPPVTMACPFGPGPVITPNVHVPNAGHLAAFGVAAPAAAAFPHTAGPTICTQLGPGCPATAIEACTQLCTLLDPSCQVTHHGCTQIGVQCHTAGPTICTQLGPGCPGTGIVACTQLCTHLGANCHHTAATLCPTRPELCDPPDGGNVGRTGPFQTLQTVCTQFGAQCQTIAQDFCTQFGPGCPTQPSGDCTFFGGCPTNACPPRTAATVCTQFGPQCPTQPNGDCTFFGNCPHPGHTRNILCTQLEAVCGLQSIHGPACPVLTAGGQHCPPISGFHCPSAIGCGSIACGQSIACHPGGGGDHQAFNAVAAPQSLATVCTQNLQCAAGPVTLGACPTQACAPPTRPPGVHCLPSHMLGCTQFGPQCPTHQRLCPPTPATICTQLAACPTHPQPCHTPAFECTMFCTHGAPGCPHDTLATVCTQLGPQCPPHTIQAPACPVLTMVAAQCLPHTIQGPACQIITVGPQCPQHSGFNCPSAVGCPSIACNQSIACQPGGDPQAFNPQAFNAVGAPQTIATVCTALPQGCPHTVVACPEPTAHTRPLLQCHQTRLLGCTQSGPQCPTHAQPHCTSFGPACPPTPATICTQLATCPTHHQPCHTPGFECTMFCTHGGPGCPNTAATVCTQPPQCPHPITAPPGCPVFTVGGPQCPAHSGFNCPSQLGCQSIACQSIACNQSIACHPGGGQQGGGPQAFGAAPSAPCELAHHNNPRAFAVPTPVAPCPPTNHFPCTILPPHCGTHFACSMLVCGHGGQ